MLYSTAVTTMTADPGLAVVTGAARGIGAPTGVALAARGWSVLLVDACADQDAFAPQHMLGRPLEPEEVAAAVAGSAARARPR